MLIINKLNCVPLSIERQDIDLLFMFGKVTGDEASELAL